MTEQFFVPPMSPVSPPDSPAAYEAQARQSPKSGEGREKGEVAVKETIPKLAFGGYPTSQPLPSPAKPRKRRRSTVYLDDEVDDRSVLFLSLKQKFCPFLTAWHKNL